MRTWLIVAALLALGFAGGFLASRAGEDERTADRPVTAAHTAPPAPTPAAPPPATGRPRPETTFAVTPLSGADRRRLRDGGFWRSACPVPLSGLQELTVTYRG